ncbi:MAG: cytochrome c5 [Oceanicoccus sp.]|jgi:cytochrome c5
MAIHTELFQGASMKRLLLPIFATLLPFNVQATEQAVIDKYNKSCIACHSSGAAGAPKTGDVAAWEPRMKKGMDVMVAHVDKGLNAMPPKGMCYDCSAEDFKAIITYMMIAK